MQLGTCRHCGATLMQGAFGCLGCGRLVDDHDRPDTQAKVQTQLGTQVRDALLDQRWRLVEPLGRGRHATTWLAQDVPFDRKAVVKLLDAAYVGDAAAVARFERNAKRLAGIENKNVVAVLALGRHEGAPFVAMRRAEGRSLAEHLHERGGRLAPTEAAFIVQQLADGYEAVHQQGDAVGALPPRSVFVEPVESRVTLLDVRSESEPAADVTEATARLTERLDWVAPEVLKGAPPSVRSDIFTLGCLAYELMCGHPPPRGPFEQLLASGGSHVPPPQPQGATLSTELRNAVVRATHHDPLQRFASAAELRDALAPFGAIFQAAAFRAAAPASGPSAALKPPLQRTFDGVKRVGEAETAPRRLSPGEIRAAEAATVPRTAVPLPPAPPPVSPAPDITPQVPFNKLARPPHLEEPGPWEADPKTKPGSEWDVDTKPAAGTADTADAFDDSKEDATRTFTPSQMKARLEAQLPPDVRRKRKQRVIAASFVALLLLGLWLALAWEKTTPVEPLAPVALKPSVAANAAPPEPEVERKRTLEDVTASSDVQDRKIIFDREYTTEPGKGLRRARGTTKIRSQQSSEYFGMAKMGEVQIIVLYGGERSSADVSIDGKLVGPSPVYWPVTPGTHVISLERRPLEPMKVPIKIPAGKSVRLEIELIPLE